MPLSVSSNAILENNKLNSDNVTLLLLKITYPSQTPIRICLNNDTVTWDSQSWLPAIFSLDGLSESKDAEIPGVSLKFMDLSRTLIAYIDAYDGGVGAEVVLYVVNSKYLSNTTPELQHEFSIIDVTISENYMIDLKLGAENLLKRKCPTNRYLKNRCRFTFKDTATCTYSGGTSTCDLTYSSCESKNNTRFFGGFPNLGRSGFMN